MGSRYDDYQLDFGEDIGDPLVLNSRFRDIDLRLVKQEDIEKDWTRALAQITQLGLDRINEVLLPAYQEVHRLADLGAVFTGHSTTEINIEEGLKRFTITAGERDSYAPAGYVAAFVDNDGSKAVLGKVLSYDRASGVLEVDVDKASGTGSAAAWTIYPSPSSATADDRAAIEAIKTIVEGYREQCETFRLGSADDAATAELMRTSAVSANTSALAAKDLAVQARDAVVAAIAGWGSAVLGSLTVAPTTRQGGAALQVGDQYFDSNSGVMHWKTWDGSQWTVNSVPSGSEVSSVFGRTGSVSAQSNDYRGDQIARTEAQQAVVAGATVEAAIATLNTAIGSEASARSSADGNKADKSTTVSGGGLVSGGGDLSANRTLTVTKSSQAQAEAGTDDTTAMTPLRTKDAIAQLVPAGSTTVVGKVQLATSAEGTTGTSTTKVPPVAVTKAMIDAAVSSLVNSSPAALDTLKELSDALGGDANFASTVATAIGQKLAASAVSSFMLTVLDDIDAGTARSTLGAAAASHAHAISDVTNLQTSLDAKLASSAYTAADVLSKLLTVDGSGSGLDADKVRNTTPSTFGLARLSDADATAARSGLGLGTAATAASSAFQAAFFTTSGNDATFPGQVSAVDFNSTSDGTLKDRIEDIDPALARAILAQFRTVSFVMKADENSRTKYGFIAQEVERFAPEFVSVAGRHLSLNYQMIVPLLVQRNQVLEAKVDDLSSRLAALEARIA